MAGEGEGKEVRVIPSDEEGSLGSVLEGANRLELTGHPAMGEAGEGAGEGAGAGEEAGAGAEAAGADGKKPVEEPAKEFKYKTLEEAHNGVSEAERKMHEATTETAKEVAARKALEQENADLKQRLEAAAKPPEKPAVEAPKPVTPAERKAKIKTALQKIDELDPNDPEYVDKMAECWAETGVGGADVPMPNTDEINRLVGERVKEAMAAQKATDDAERAEKAKVETRDDADRLAKEAGLDMASDSLDYKRFWAMAPLVPDEIRTKPLKDQVEWAVGEVQKLRGPTAAELAAAGAANQNKNTPLGKGGQKVSLKPQPEPEASLGGMFEKQKEARTL